MLHHVRPETFFFYLLKGPAADTEAYCATLWWRWLVSSVFPRNGAPVEWNSQGKTEVFGEKPVPVPCCPPQIPHGPTLSGERPVTKRLSHGTALLKRLVIEIHVTVKWGNILPSSVYVTKIQRDVTCTQDSGRTSLICFNNHAMQLIYDI
jgi:hypothetical protein